VDYGPNTVPLPFGFSGAIAVGPGIEQREVDLFWAGKRVWSLRPLCLKRIEQVLGRTFQDTYDQSEYSRRLSSARIGLSLFGSGFDSVRFWEIPAHGVMLLAERPPIRIPNNFINAESAVFFDDLPELEQKLNHYLARSDEACEIAAEGRRHFLKYHTASARARQFLGHLESRLSW
jgi:spore maturation protein CgeB